MRDTMAYGGPDAANNYINKDKTLGLGHRRLSILDLSEAGTQPIRYKHWVIVYNGEIYNFKEIREELGKKGYIFATGTDTEMILKAYEAWGLDCVSRFKGMFAFAIWDESENMLLLCRDRIGVKPLYYYSKEGLFMFASELKAFHQHPDFNKTINHKSVSQFLQQGYIPSPQSIFKYVKKVQPGSWLRVDTDNKTSPSCYWDIGAIYNQSDINTNTEEEVIEELEPILKESFQYRMVSDVPVGMFLSGGIDSSLVSAILQKQSNTQLKTFTIGFDNKKYNEAIHAQKIAQHIGTDHTELYCQESDFEKLIPLLPDLYDEPLGAGSAIPTYLVSQLAKEQVKVSLSADGGDEIFGGYTKYEFAKNVYSKLEKTPRLFKSISHHMMGYISPEFVDKRLSKLPFISNYTNIGTKYSKLRNALQATSLSEFYNQSSSIISQKELLNLIPPWNEKRNPSLDYHKDRVLSILGIYDMTSFLEGEVMVKVDRATMNVALEGREPFLDQHIIEYGLTLPDHLKIKGNTTKYILRQILYKHVPKELIERPKQGFDIPMRQWTFGFLKDEILSLAEDDGFIVEFGFYSNQLKNIIHSYYDKSATTDPHFIWYLFVLYKWYLRWIRC